MLFREGHKMKVRELAVVLVSTLHVWASVCSAAGQIPGLRGTVAGLPPVVANQIPQLQPNGIIQGATVSTNPDTRRDITQTQPKAIIDWKSFDIGENATVYFHQKPTDAVLNRIYDNNPSQILGSLGADGKVYLVNQNGILFGPKSQVNVRSLTASTLNITNSNFLNDTFSFNAEDYQNKGALDPGAFVVNNGKINADYGSVFLVGRNVQNNGSIQSNYGQIGLAAGKKVSIYPDTATQSQRAALRVDVTPDSSDPNDTSMAINSAGANLQTDGGLTGMYGKTINQNGNITATSSGAYNGSIEITASKLISTGPSSYTGTPVTDSTERLSSTFDPPKGTIQLIALAGDGTGTILHQGTIQSPAGQVTLNADSQIYLDSGSVIDVKGYLVQAPISETLITGQMNSVQLRDDYGQKSGIIKGGYITASGLSGSAIGDITGYIRTLDATARERSTTGGSITLSATGDSSNIIIKPGSTIDFSGGGIQYSGGIANTTKLLSGTKVYDISNAPEWLNYDSILGSLTVSHPRYGITETFYGLYFGGAAPVGSYVNGYFQGSDAGSLSIYARQMAIDGALLGSATRGVYQNQTDEKLDSSTGQALAKTMGLREPKGGTLIIGSSLKADGATEAYTEEIVVKSNTTPTNSFTPDQPTVISSTMLNATGASYLELNANQQVTIDSDANLSLKPGSGLTILSRKITNKGTIDIPSGNVDIETKNTVTSPEASSSYKKLDNMHIYLAEGSRISVAGAGIDRSLEALQGSLPANSQYTNGGAITLRDLTTTKIDGSVTEQGEGVIVRKGAVLDVSGGYEKKTNGSISSGAAGTLELTGRAVVVEGNLKGFSGEGQTGGTLIMRAQQVSVQNSVPLLPGDYNLESSLPDNFKNKLVLSPDTIQNGGFTRIQLTSADDMTVDAILKPSNAKIQWSDSAAPSIPGSSMNKQTDGIVNVDSAYIGKASVTLEAGKGVVDSNLSGIIDNLNAVLTFNTGSGIYLPPASGDISAKSPIINVKGILSAPGSNITLTTKTGGGDLTVYGTGQLLANGGLLPSSPAIKGLAADYTPFDAGTVTLTANGGSAKIESGALIDVSAPDPTTNHIVNTSGSPDTVSLTGNPGTVSISYAGNVVLDGTITGHAAQPGMKGGAFTLTNTSTTADAGLNLTGNILDKITQGGFDDLSFTAARKIAFSGDITASVGRHLALDAPVISGDGSSVKLSAPWIELRNSTSDHTFIPDSADPGRSTLMLASQWLDISGSTVLSGFSDVNFRAVRDIRLSDAPYSGWSKNYEGQLKLAGNLTLTADHIYPTTDSSFLILASGTVTTGNELRATPYDAPIYSAAGSIEIRANNIDHEGFIAAPMGSITLNASDRVYAAPGSVLSTHGSNSVLYGYISASNWQHADKTDPSNSTITDVTSPPVGSITLTGNEAIVRSGAMLDFRGGGNIFSFDWQKGVEGSYNPLTKTSATYVIIPDSAYQLPGKSIYLEAASGLPAGTYSILPSAYAFLPGAYVVTSTGKTIKSGNSYVSKEGYNVVAGYLTDMGTGLKSSNTVGYTVRPASDVLKEGYFETRQILAGNGGSLEVSGSSAVLSGTIAASPLSGYTGGKLTVAGKNITLSESLVDLPSGFNFQSDLPSNLVGVLSIAPSSIANKGFQDIEIGKLDITRTITMEASTLSAPKIGLHASDKLELKSGATINALSTDSGYGGITLDSPTGDLIFNSGASLHASNSMEFKINAIDTLDGSILNDSGSIGIKTSNITFSEQGAATGLLMTADRWSKIAAVGSVTLQSDNDILFTNNYDLNVTGALTLDSRRIADANNANVSITATGNMNILNSSGSAGTPGAPAGAGIITLAGKQISVGHGDVLFDGFSGVTLSSKNDLALAGKGSLQTTGQNLSLYASQVTMASSRNSGGAYERPNFTVSAGSGTGNITIGPPMSPDSPNQVTPFIAAPGGGLELDAGRIDVSTSLSAPAGYVNINASGGGIFLHNGASILAKGDDYNPAGTVRLFSSGSGGQLSLSAGSLIDVSAGNQGDAGSISLEAPLGSITLAGTLNGNALNGGAGGSLNVDVASISNLGMYTGAARNGGFTGDLSFRARSGDVNIGYDLRGDNSIKANRFSLTADQGSVNIAGTVDASGSSGGSIRINAGGDLVLYKSSLLMANATDSTGKGGTVSLNSEGGQLKMLNSLIAGDASTQDGALIDVSGGAGGGKGGTVWLRAASSGNNDAIRMNIEKGNVNGAYGVYAEGFNSYNYTSIGSSEISTMSGNAKAFSNNSNSIKTNQLSNLILTGSPAGSDGLQVIPGIEISSDGLFDAASSTNILNLSSAWSLNSSTMGSKSGALTIRSGYDLNIAGNLLSYPSGQSVFQRGSNQTLDSWKITLTAGADRNSSDTSATVSGRGIFTLNDQKMVYSESAPVGISAGGGIVLNTPGNAVGIDGGYMSFSIGTYDAPVAVQTGGALTMNGGVIQSATGNIEVNAGSIALQNNGIFQAAIRTVGEPPPLPWDRSQGNRYTAFSFYYNGGNISINSPGDITGQYFDISSYSSHNYWDNIDGAGRWSALHSQSQGTSGIATLAGGNVHIRTFGDFAGKAGTFGTGDLSIYASGDMDGRFLVKNGNGYFNSGSNFGTDSTKPPIFEMFDAKIKLSAQGDILLDSIVNPTMVDPYVYQSKPQLQYAEDSSVSLISQNGNVTINGADRYLVLAADYLPKILPPNLDITAKTGDINIKSDSLVLAPSSVGNLYLYAGGNINGRTPQAGTQLSTIFVSDQAPAAFYSSYAMPTGYSPDFSNLANFTSHGYPDAYLSGYASDHDSATPPGYGTPLHQNDQTPILVTAGGDISNLGLGLPKRATIKAGNDIKNLYLEGQNINSSDITMVQAGHDILFTAVLGSTTSASTDIYTPRIEQNGPGALLIQAGNSIDLGRSPGITTIGNLYNQSLSSTGSSLIMVAGYNLSGDPSGVSPFFDQLRDAGQDYSETLAKEGKTAALQKIADIRQAKIDTYLGSKMVYVDTEKTKKTDGNINMTSSQIGTASGGDAYVMSSGKIEVGVTAITSDADRTNTGINTQAGGRIGIYAVGDINVNESRVMSWFGGDIIAWSDTGNVNAGRGSKTSINTGKPKKVPKPGGGFVIEQKPASVGSGMRAMTYDPDGPGPETAPKIGDIYLFAPQGVIDAGEAGISGGKVVLGATQVLNVQNISFTVGSVGMPTTSEANIGISAMSGVSSLTDQNKMLEQVSGMASAKDQLAKNAGMGEQSMGWLDVKVISYDE